METANALFSIQITSMLFVEDILLLYRLQLLKTLPVSRNSVHKAYFKTLLSINRNYALCARIENPSSIFCMIMVSYKQNLLTSIFPHNCDIRDRKAGKFHDHNTFS